MKKNIIVNKKTMFVLNFSIIITFLILFAIYFVLKLTNPQLIVGGENNKIKHDYKVKVEDSTSEDKNNYKYVFDNGNNCSKNYPLGVPELKYDMTQSSALFCYKKYAVQYNVKTKTPIWESHVLRKEDFIKGKYYKRKDSFKEDKNIANTKFSSKPSDYSRSGFDRGHLAPSADFIYDEEIMSESFYMTNIAPQVPVHNQNIWANLESSIRKLLKHKNIEELYITTGILYYKPETKTEREAYEVNYGILKNGVLVPTFFYKIIVEPKTGQSAAYLIPNISQVGNQDFNNFLIKIKDLENITQINYHSQLKDEMSYQIEYEKSGSLARMLR